MDLIFDKNSILQYNLNLFNSYGIFRDYSIDHTQSIKLPYSDTNRVKIISNWEEGYSLSQIYYWELFNYSIKECLLFSQTFGNILCKNFLEAENKNVELIGDKFVYENKIIGISYIFNTLKDNYSSLFLFKENELDFANYNFSTSFTNLVNYLEVNSIVLPIQQQTSQPPLLS